MASVTPRPHVISTTRALRRVAVATWLPALLIAGWWVITSNIESSAFPPAGDVVEAFRNEWLFKNFRSDLVPTLRALAIAISISTVLGIVIGLALGLSRRAEVAFSPLIDWLRAIPKVLLISPVLLIVGIGEPLTVTVLVSGAVWPILLGAIYGARGLSSTIRDVRRAYRISRRDWVLRMVVPGALPQISAGIRNGLAIAVVLLVVAEAVGAPSGVGYQLRDANQSFRTAEMWAAMLLFGLLGYGVNVLYRVIERRILSWHYQRLESRSD